MNLSTYTTRVKREVPGCRAVLVREALLWAARDLCRESHLWKRNLPDITFGETGCSQIYFLAGGMCCEKPNTPKDSTVWSDDVLWCDGNPIEPVRDSVDVHMISVTAGHCVSWDIGEQVVTFSGTPGTTVSGIRAILIPKALEVPELMERYETGIVAGSLWKLMSMSGMSWSHNSRAKERWLEYERVRIESKTDAASDYLAQPIRLSKRALQGAP